MNKKNQYEGLNQLPSRLKISSGKLKAWISNLLSTGSHSQITKHTYEQTFLSVLEAAKSSIVELEFLNMFLDELKEDDSILEIGSYTGDDAAYIGSKGYNVIATDNFQSSLEQMKLRFALNDKIKPLRLDIIHCSKDLKDISQPYNINAILAKQVFQHLNTEELHLALYGIYSSLPLGGTCAFTLEYRPGKDLYKTTLYGEEVGLQRYVAHHDWDTLKESLKQEGRSVSYEELKEIKPNDLQQLVIIKKIQEGGYQDYEYEAFDNRMTLNFGAAYLSGLMLLGYLVYSGIIENPFSGIQDGLIF